MEMIMNEGSVPVNLDSFDAEIASTEDIVAVPLVAEPEDTEGEDLLLAEIDAFRSKAAQLQKLINDKESKAAELETLVAEKEAVNRELQDELTKKHEQADAIVADVENQVDRLLQNVKNDMDLLAEEIKAQVNNNHASYIENAKKFDEALEAVNQQVAAMQNDLSDKTHNESVHLFRLIQDTLKESDRTDELIARSEDQFKVLKKFTTVITIVAALSLCTSIAVLLRSLGVI